MIHIPTKFNNLLKAYNDEISAAVGKCVELVEPFLTRNEAPFFSDYTDHGITHIQSVLNSCELLLSDEAWEVLTRQDVAVIIMATLAHDLGMLINTDGFRYLISKKNSIKYIEKSDHPWDKLWREFMLEVKRFDGVTLLNLSGSTEPLNDDELQPDGLTERGMKIVGEFFRRHHHRLAHEIILHGMPSENGRVQLFADAPNYLQSLAGIVARSHGLSVRESVDSQTLAMMDKTAYRQFKNTHPTFLMAIIRLSDYLDLGIGRAPGSILAAKSLRSPLSRREWWSQRVIIDCHSFGDDPECLQIVVEPSALKDVNVFYVIESKINGLQKELDSCWAILGEVYGRVPPLNKLCLRLRRVRSNLRTSAIINQLPFVPDRASLRTSNADLLKLLIEPLYGDSPSIGIRELIQNSIDAVREFEFVIQKTPSLTSVHREDLDSDVAVFFEKDHEGNNWITVRDRGIGMTWQTVSNYYLTVGASFRNSDAWKKEFKDAGGNSEVLRSGRFGIGVLAAFLLGDQVRVSTRHIEEPRTRGLSFEFGFEDTSVELRWMNRSVGTTVSVRVNEKIIKRLHKYIHPNYFSGDSWNWYLLDKPVLARFSRTGKQIKSTFTLPGEDGPLPSNWHRIYPSGFKCVDWSYGDMRYLRLVCNGIVIRSGYIILSKEFDKEYQDHYPHSPSHLILKAPLLSVFDPDGRLPLNLTRDDLARKLIGFEPLLAEDISRNFIAYCLLRGPKSSILDKNLWHSYTSLKYPGIDSDTYLPEPCVFDARDGFGLCDAWNIASFTSQKCLIIRAPKHNLDISDEVVTYIKHQYGMIYGVSSDSTLERFDLWHRQLILYNKSECLLFLKHIKISGLRTIMPMKWYSRLLQKQPLFIRSAIKEEKTDNSISILTIGKCPEVSSEFSEFSESISKDGISFESITEVYFEVSDEHPKPGLIAKVWKDSIGGPIIPFNKSKRQKIIEGLNAHFSRHLDHWSIEDKKIQRKK